MLQQLKLAGVGPLTDSIPIDFATRLNLLTGDNGLGKTFLLDVAWWALTGSWPDRPAWPNPDTNSSTPMIEAMVQGKSTSAPVTGTYDFPSEQWGHPQARPPMPGMVLYFRVDGQFSLWDPAQHYWKRSKTKQIDDPSRPNALHFLRHEVWNSVSSADGKIICRGLIEDWVTWQQTKSEEFTALCTVLSELSPSGPEKLVPGEPMSVWLDDVRPYPTLELPYGRTPVTLVSAGMQRILLLAYLLIWAWNGHRRASQLIRQDPERRMVVIFDEPETHLHPQWQRTLLPSLISAIQSLQSDMQAQFLVSTHSPLVLASMEPIFDNRHDKLFSLVLSDETNNVIIETNPFVKRGDTVNWLVSEVFGLNQARSLPAEIAVEAAKRFMRGEADKNPESLRTQNDIHEELLRQLGDRDPFWPRWIVKTGQV